MMMVAMPDEGHKPKVSYQPELDAWGQKVTTYSGFFITPKLSTTALPPASTTGGGLVYATTSYPQAVEGGVVVNRNKLLLYGGLTFLLWATLYKGLR